MSSNGVNLHKKETSYPKFLILNMEANLFYLETNII